GALVPAERGHLKAHALRALVLDREKLGGLAGGQVDLDRRDLERGRAGRKSPEKNKKGEPRRAEPPEPGGKACVHDRAPFFSEVGRCHDRIEVGGGENVLSFWNATADIVRPGVPAGGGRGCEDTVAGRTPHPRGREAARRARALGSRLV